MVLSMKVNVGQKGMKHLPKKKYTKTSITIEIGGLNIDSQCIFLMYEFWKSSCIFGLCILEQGGSLCHLHLQMVCKLCQIHFWIIFFGVNLTHFQSFCFQSRNEMSTWVECSNEISCWSCSSLQTLETSRFAYLCCNDRILCEGCKKGTFQCSSYLKN